MAEAAPATTAIFSARDITVEYRASRGDRRKGSEGMNVAVRGVNLDLHAGEIVGLVGESGSGKSTLARVLVGLQTPADGQLYFRGEGVGTKRSGAQRRAIQMVFQDSQSALNPRMTVSQTLSEVLQVSGRLPRRERERRVEELLDLVHLPAGVADVRPRRLSGGQRQRVGIARALALKPEILIADEAVSALDVSVQAAILNLMLELRERLGLTVLFISHNLAVIRQVADRVVVLYLGAVVESSPADQFFAGPAHPYTAGLLAAVPRLHGGGDDDPTVVEPISPSTPGGCSFAPHCTRALAFCRQNEPVLQPAPSDPTWEVACHNPVPRIASTLGGTAPAGHG
jgi:oligopeptide/dipeptide ABC transporter ATP-binding protein